MDLPEDLQDRMALAIRAGELAGLPASRVRGGALMAVAEILLDRAENISIAAQYADRLAYRKQEEGEAESMRQLALDMKAEASQLEADT